MKTLIFYSKAGGGHQKAAEIIATGLIQEGAQVKLKNGFDILDEGNFDFAPFAYRLLIGPLYFLWIIIVWLQKSFAGFFLLGICYQIGKLFLYKKFEKFILEYKPQNVISTYYFFGQLARQISEKNNLDLKITTVVTDPFSPEKVWFADKKGQYLVYTKAALDLALSHGLKTSQLNVVGPIVGFEAVDNQKLKSLQKEINLDFKKPLVLVLGGGEGMQKGTQILKEVLNSKLDIQLIMVCGRNQKLYDKCSSIIEKLQARSKVKLYKFVDFVPELIAISKVVVSKAGPGAVFEVLKQNKPLILCEYIWPQEKGVVSFVEENNLGVFKPSVEELIKEISLILSNKKVIKKIDIEQVGFDLSSGLETSLKALI
jgi:UDP-N-acetylglucosamine:LPS N-acetylglucosamine transferase